MMRKSYTASHWGIYEVEHDGVQPVLKGWQQDAAPSAIGLHMLEASQHPLRIGRPAVRQSWLQQGPGSNPHLRGREPFVEVTWEEAIALVGDELGRVIGTHGNQAIFGGSAGWSSAGRFHHAQSQLHRFLNGIGGYVRSVDSYSNAAATVLLPHVIASMPWLTAHHTTWDVLAAHTELFVSFGGVPLKNSQITNGSAGRHRTAAALTHMRERGVAFVNISPTRDDLETGAEVDWFAVRPNTDTALMLALCHTLIANQWHAAGFVASHCSGFDEFRRYLFGLDDGIVKDACWAAPICQIEAARTVTLARRMATSRTMVNISWSLQRARHGEQPFWALIALAALLGQIGLPGGGFGLGYGAMNAIGNADIRFAGPTLAQGKNAVSDFIPVARLTDMLLHPGKEFRYNGGHYRYPHIRLVYWCGGNPFHHQQDLNRLRRAWQRPQSVIVHEQFWNPQARMADVVLPVTTTLERDDIAFAARERHLVAMRQVLPAYADALDDHAIFARLAGYMGHEAAFTEGRSSEQWLRHLYQQAQANAASAAIALPDFDQFRAQGVVDFDYEDKGIVMLADFRRDPQQYPLPTPSGRIELYSQVIAGFGLADCPPHPAWLPPEEWQGASLAQDYPLHLISDQPANKLHSQLDHSRWSRAAKRHGREPLHLHPDDAGRRAIGDGDAVRVFNRRGACIAIAQLNAAMAPGVVRLSTGAWLDPWYDGEPTLDKHGNPNMLTSDRPTSALAQGCAAQSCLVDIVRWEGPLPAVSAFDLPDFVARAVAC
ncbi:molybdopterin-dependent oxidoreductase [Herbaspirillum autotrophicum]|uniref:molybdopterin-dependent oxidoreductase n=1 Tax=Herbaspirillum autotrophicum TaxID=180195 RepID=UPI000AEF1641|nr:molybdopterin-dependent oxidoreductase [Herbaspirillum autotrophicum]